MSEFYTRANNSFSQLGQAFVFLNLSAHSHTLHLKFLQRCLLIDAIGKHGFQSKKYEPVGFTGVSCFVI